MTNLAFVDFEANGFPDEDGTYRACLTYINTRSQYQFNQLFVTLDDRFQKIDWKSNTEDMEIIFARIWSTYKENEDWKTNLLKIALEHLAILKKWYILTKNTTTKGEPSTQHYLCYEEDMNHIDEHNLPCQPFDHNNKDHRQVVLDTAFSTTVLSCAVLYVQETDNKITIIKPKEYIPKDSDIYSEIGDASCYYQVYKQDEHYVHSISAQRVHNLSRDYLQTEGVELEKIIDVFRPLLTSDRRTIFVAHNDKTDRKYILNTLQQLKRYYEYKSAMHPENSPEYSNYNIYTKALETLSRRIDNSSRWICTLTRARKKYKDQVSDKIDADTTQISEEDVLDEDELEDYTLQNLYEFITGTVMPKRHDAQMDVYACATIYCATCDIRPDTTALKTLIAKIIPDQIVCTKPVDFWRYALLDKFRSYLTQDKQNPAKTDWLTSCQQSKQIPLESFISITSDWYWCLKYDGFYIRLTRDSTSRWQMSTRSGVQLHPPTSFLQHLPTTFPKGMEIEAELVFDSNQMCELSDRPDAKKRIVKRTLGFAKLHISSLRSTKDLSGWNGMRLVLFAFPLKGTTFEQSFQEGSAIIQASQEQHPHISTCKYESVESTEKTIQIFQSVVQMGLEGIILRKKTSVYQNTTDASTSIYKMKQKIVTIRKQEFKQIGQVRMTRDGRVRPEREYEVINFNDEDSRKTCKFTDSRDPPPLDENGNYKKRLKWHERATSKMNVWDLNYLGIRHLCFATDLDLSFEVQPNAYPTFEAQVNQMLTETKPFIFTIETVYLFLAFHTYKPPVTEYKKSPVHGQMAHVNVGVQHVIDIGMLKFTGRTGEIINPQEYHHRKYTRSHLQVKGKQLGETRDLVTTLTQFLHHIPYDNKKFVFVVNNQHVLKFFKEMTDELMDVDQNEVRSLPEERKKERLIENANFRRTIHRLEFNDKARKQQVEVVYMHKFRRNIPIPWNPYGAAGRIPHKDLDPNSFCALLSPEMSEYDFKKDAQTQFNLYVELQNLWNFVGVDEIIRQKLKKSCVVHELPDPFDDHTIYLDLVCDMQESNSQIRTKFYEKISTLGLDYARELKTIYEKLSVYSLQHDKLRRITLSDFQETFRPARAIEKSCPDDPATKTFPYRTEAGGINRWHMAWHMSYAFFKAKELPAPWTVYTDPVPVQAQSGPAPQRQDARPTSRKSRAPRQQPAASRPPLPSLPRPVPPRPVPQQPTVVDLTDSPPSSPAQNPASKKQVKRKQTPPDVVVIMDSPPASPKNKSPPTRSEKRDASQSPDPPTPSRRKIQPTKNDALPQSDVAGDESNVMESDDDNVTSPILLRETTTRNYNQSEPDEMEPDDVSVAFPILLREPTKRNYNHSEPDEMESDDEQAPTTSHEPEVEAGMPPDKDEMESEDDESEGLTNAEKWLKREMKNNNERELTDDQINELDYKYWVHHHKQEDVLDCEYQIHHHISALLQQLKIYAT